MIWESAVNKPIRKLIDEIIQGPEIIDGVIALHRFVVSGHTLTIREQMLVLQYLGMFAKDPETQELALLNEIYHHTDTWTKAWMEILTGDEPFYAGQDPTLANTASLMA